MEILKIRKKILSPSKPCDKTCPLYNTSPSVPAKFQGNLDIMLIGEAPGPEELKERKPFVGRAGKELHKILLEADIAQGYITNIVKCMPRKDNSFRRPTKEECSKCYNCYLKYEIEAVKPKHIILLGSTAVETILELDKVKMSDYVYIEQKKDNMLIHIFYHPSYLIRNPAEGVKHHESMVRYLIKRIKNSSV